MAFDPDDPKQLSRLLESVKWSRDRLRGFREERLDSLRFYVGHRYTSGAGITDRSPVNLVEMLVSVTLRQLIAYNPRTLLKTHLPSLRAGAADFQVHLNETIAEMNLQHPLQSAVLDAHFTMGVVKMGLEELPPVEVEGMTYRPTRPFVDWVSFDDWVHDMRARTNEEIGFSGDRYRVPLSEIKASNLYDPKAVEQLETDKQTSFNESGDERSEVISLGHERAPSEFDPFVELYDIWLRREGLIVTVPADLSSTEPLGKPLRVTEWTGPERGPYYTLGFNKVPGQTIPLSPVSVLIDLAEFVNRIYRKILRQAERQKNIGLTPMGRTGDAKQVVEADDGMVVAVEDPASTVERSFGGMDQQSLALAIHAKNLFSNLGGNLELMGGLGAQSETLGQDQMLQANASRRISDMQERTLEFTQDIIEGLAFYLWNDPQMDRRTSRLVPGTQQEVPVNISPEERRGKFSDYHIKVEPYSMQAKTPSQRLQFIDQFLQRVVLPNLPLMAQQGIGLDFGKLFGLYAKYGDQPEIQEFLVRVQPPQAGGGAQNGGPSVTRRENVRISKPGATPSGRDAVLQQTLLGSKLQPSETAAAGR